MCEKKNYSSHFPLPTSHLGGHYEQKRHQKIRDLGAE